MFPDDDSESDRPSPQHKHKEVPSNAGNTENLSGSRENHDKSTPAQSRFGQPSEDYSGSYGYLNGGSSPGVQGLAAQSGPHTGKASQQFSRRPEFIEDEIDKVLREDGRIDPSNVSWKVEAGVLILTGTVGNNQMKADCSECCGTVHGVQEIRNELKIERPDSER